MRVPSVARIRDVKRVRFASAAHQPLKALTLLVASILLAANASAPEAGPQAGQPIHTVEESPRPTLPTPPQHLLVRNVLPRAMRGREALDAIRADKRDAVAKQNGQSIEALAKLLADDPTA